MKPRYTHIQGKKSPKKRSPNIQNPLIAKALPMNPNHINMSLPKSPQVIRSKNIPAAVHLPGTK